MKQFEKFMEGTWDERCGRHEQNISKVLQIIWVTENNTLKLDIQPLLVGLDNKNIAKRIVLATGDNFFLIPFDLFLIIF